MSAHLVIQDFEPDLEARLQEVARQEKLSLAEAAKVLMRRGAGLTASPVPIGHALDDLMGTWSPEEAQEFENTVAVFKRIDEDMWK